MNSDYINQVLNDRLNVLVDEAAAIRRNIMGAKTQTKKQYYERKFKKVQGAVLKLVVALNNLPKDTTSSTLTPTELDTNATS